MGNPADTCSTCGGYEFVPNQYDPDDDMLVDCPDCRAIDVRPLVWCPVHSTRVSLDGCCAKCVREAEAAIARIEARRAALSA